MIRIQIVPYVISFGPACPHGHVKARLGYRRVLEMGCSYKSLNATEVSLRLDHWFMGAYSTMRRSTIERFELCSTRSGYFNHRNTKSAVTLMHFLNTTFPSQQFSYHTLKELLNFNFKGMHENRKINLVSVHGLSLSVF